MTTTITFKAKIKEFADNEGQYIEFKKTVGRVNCPLKPHQHTYYNSDLFTSILQRAYDKALNGKRWARLADLPAAVTLDNPAAFMVTVTVEIEV